MKRGQVVKILLEDGRVVQEGIKHIKNNIFFTNSFNMCVNFIYDIIYNKEFWRNKDTATVSNAGVATNIKIVTGEWVMRFEQALQAMREGKKVKRKCSRNYYKIIDNVIHITIVDADGEEFLDRATLIDVRNLLCEDWEIVDE